MDEGYGPQEPYYPVMYAPKSTDPELRVIETIVIIMEGDQVTDESRPRILRYLADRYGL